MESFDNIGLSENILKAISELGYTSPMPVQEQAIPMLLEKDCDLVALAQTGTGKTAAFGLPLLQKTDPKDNRTQALVLCPTRELCLQIAADLTDYSRYIDGMSVLAVYGGASIKNQIQTLSKGAQIVVATPGRLLDLVGRGIADLSSVRYVVMDEADEMLNMGFLEDIDRILSSVPEGRHTMLFSATMPDEIASLSLKYMQNPEQICIGTRNQSASTVRHICYTVHSKDKYRTLKRIVDFYPRIYGIIFCRTKVETQEISDHLIKDGYNVDALHGDLSQQQRDYVMNRFRLHNIQLLVATDVAARGIDVDDLTHIINYTIPDEPEIYTHRSGRTGRAGKSGISIAIVNMRESGKIRQIEKVTGRTFEPGRIPTGKEICSKQIFSLVDRIENTVVQEEEMGDLLLSVTRRLEWLDKDELVRRIVAMEFNRMIKYYQDDEDFEAAKETPSRRRSIEVPVMPGYSKIFINVGKMDGFGAKHFLGLINDCVEGDVEVGRIDIFTRYSLMDVACERAEDVMRELSTLKLKGRAIRANLATEEQITRGVKPKDETPSSSSRRDGRRDRKDRKDRKERKDRKRKDR